MPTLNELMEKFAAPADETNHPGGDNVPDNNSVAHDGDTTKIASGGEESMQSLQDIYEELAGHDMNKVAQAAAEIPEFEEVSQEEVDFAKMAAVAAGAEADEILVDDDEPDFRKIAAEYDAAGRIMARGFVDEFSKLAGALDTSVTDNQMTESPSAAATPALGDRGLPTVKTNFAGNDAHDGQIETTGPGPREVYKDVLKPAKTISAGQTGDDPEALAVSLGGGSPAGSFATVRDLQV